MLTKYFDNIIFFLQKSGGGSVYWGELIKRFSCDTDSVFIQPKLDTENIVFNQIELNNTIKEIEIPLNILRYLPLTIKIDDGSIFHSSFYRYSIQKGVKNVTTVHDFTNERFSKGLSRFVHHKQKGLAVKNSSGIICISQKTKNDLYEFYPHFMKGKMVEVIYNGVSDDFFLINDKESILKDFQSELHRYVLFIGHRSYYKNFDFAVEVIKNLPQEYKLLIVGNPLTELEKIMLEKNISNKYYFLGNISNKMLNEIYNISECLLYPSNYEGFGIPVIEAFKSGCPVIAQRIAVLEEITNDAAILVDGLNKNNFIDKIKQLKNDRFKSELINLGISQADKFSWERCTQEVNNFYETI
jgi:glycosyltransferase involved in cell wall biosynthesis